MFNVSVGSIVRQVISKLAEALKSVEEIEKESENCEEKRTEHSD